MNESKDGIKAEAGAPFAGSTGYTAPSEIPRDVAAKLVACRDALVQGDTDEAWHQLYSIADPTFTSLEPWLELERYNVAISERANQSKTL